MIFFRRSPEYDPEEGIPFGLRAQLWTSGWRGALVLVVLTVTLLALWKGRDAYHALKVKRAEMLVAQAVAAGERGDAKEEFSKLSQATTLLQRHPITLRAVGRYQLARDPIAALGTFAQLLKTGEATTEDQRSFARLAFRVGRPEMAAEVIEELKKHPAGGAAVVLALQAQQRAWNGRWAEALDFARQAGAAPDTGEHVAYAQGVLARILLQAPAPKEAQWAEAVALLGSLARRKDEAGLEALGILIELSQNQQTAPLLLHHQDVEAWMAAVESHPRAEPVLKVRAWGLRLAAEPARRVEIAQELYERYRREPSSVLRREAARWLNQRGLNRLALEMAEASKFESEEWFLLYLDAVAATGDWEQVFRTLTAREQNVPLSPSLRQLFTLRAASETGRNPDVSAAWREIRVSSRLEDARTQLYVASYAERTGFPAEAALIYRRLVDTEVRGPAAPENFGRAQRQVCFTGLLRTAGASMPLPELIALVGKFAGEFPEIDEVSNDSAYLQLLGGATGGGAEETARRLLQKKPELLAYRTTAALAALRRKDIAAAAAIYDGWTIDWATAPDRFKVVYIAVMRAAGRAADADKVMAGLKAEALRPEERQLAGLPAETVK